MVFHTLTSRGMYVAIWNAIPKPAKYFKQKLLKRMCGTKGLVIVPYVMWI